MLLCSTAAIGCGGGGPASTPPPPPPPPAVASIQLEPQDTTVEVEGTFQLRAVAKSAAGQTISGVSIAFTAQTPGIVDLNATGQLVGAQTGTTTVTAAASGITASTTVQVRTKVVVFDIPAPRTFAEVYGVDDAGAVVGALYGRGIPEPFISGTPPNLTLLAPLVPDVPAQARSISSAGLIVGYSYAVDQQNSHLVTWSKAGAISDLGPLGLTHSIGVGVTPAATILVSHDRLPPATPVEGATLRAQGGGLTPIPGLTGPNGYFLPTALASATAVVGISVTAADLSVPAIWHSTTGTEQLVDLPADAYPAAMATGDRLVGFFDPAQPKAFLWNPTDRLRNLGTLGGAASHARGINEAGTVVGAAQRSDGYYHAFSWTTAGGFTDLGTSLTGASEAWAISPSGIIAGLVYPSTNPVPGTQTGANRVVVWISKRRP